MYTDYTMKERTKKNSCDKESLYPDVKVSKFSLKKILNDNLTN